MLQLPFAALLLTASPAAAQDSPRRRADAHFLAGFDHRRAGKDADARREWAACLEIEPGHDFCDYALSTLPAAPDAETKEAVPAPVERPAPGSAGAIPKPKLEGDTPSPLRSDKTDWKSEHEATQSYLTGLVYYQKGDEAKARAEWERAKKLAPAGSGVASDAAAALAKLDGKK